MAAHTLDPAQFRAMFPAFADATKFPDATLQVYWDLATEWLGGDDGPLLCGSALQTALNYMTAHLLELSTRIAAGNAVAGPVTQATIDKVSVTIAAAPPRSEWGWWLVSTPYGAQLYAFLKLKGAGGLYIGGSPARAGFRGPRGF
jgi:hypothetical protein